MYPASYFGLFPPFPRKNTVFVAMSFDARFDARWSNVIAQAISRIPCNEKPLEPVRVDTRRISDSVLTEILAGIGSCRLVFADITTVEYANGRPIRNGNVMYEVGIAHATRLPEEVLLFRSDEDPLLFDVANVRVNSYLPEEEPEKAKNAICESIIAAIKELDLRRNLAIQKAVETLDLPSWRVLSEVQVASGINHPAMKTMGQVLGNTQRVAAIQRLLDLGAIRTKFIELTPETFEQVKGPPDAALLSYVCTEFGKALFKEGGRRMGLTSPAMTAIVERELSEK